MDFENSLVVFQFVKEQSIVIKNKPVSITKIYESKIALNGMGMNLKFKN